MNILSRLKAAAAPLFAAVLAALSLAATADSLPSAKAPALKSVVVESLRLPAEAAATPVRLDAPDAAAVDAMKRANGRATTKRVQIGLNRELPDVANARSSALDWQPVEGGFAARWSVTSSQAKALRVGLSAKRTTPSIEMRFTGLARPGTVYGPFTEADLNASAGATYWSPVLEGDTAIVELFVAGSASPREVDISVDKIAHLVASPADPAAGASLKIGESESCEVNFVCRASSDAGLAFAGEAVARMTFSDGTGTFLCTGTMLNSAAGTFVPYFYTADHCIDNQSTASTLTTHWFYESTICTGNNQSPDYVQVAGGATLLYVNSTYDISFMRLNRSPPSNATFAGWDSTQLSSGAALTAIHHPAGDLKKVSLGSFGGYTVPTGLGRTVPFIQSNWLGLSTGVTEGGSSGSGIFTKSGGDYAFRGGLLGGPSSCTASASNLFDWYSRFDVAYENIGQYLAAPAASANYTALWWNPSENGWGINVDQQGDIVFATLFTYDSNGAPMWLVMSNGARQGSGDTFSGPLYRTTGTPFNQPFTGANVTQVGTMTLSFSGGSSGTLSYSVSGVSVSKSITKQLFGPTGAAACTPTAGSRASATNYTDLWFSPSESGWGINLTQQGNVMFATLFTYGSGGEGLWLVMSAGARQGDGSFTGALYQTTEKNGQGFNAQPWPGVNVTQVGTMTLRFGNGENGTLTYSVNGTTVSKTITRQVFSTPVPLCN